MGLWTLPSRDQGATWPKRYAALVNRLRYAAPNAITIASLVLGMLAIQNAFQGQYAASAALIVFATIVDTFDGLAARLLHATSAFGKYLDTLCDAVTVGVAPGVLVYAVYFKGWAVGGLIAAGWTAAVLARLAYFQATEARDPLYFIGLPSPPAADILVGFVLFSSYVWHHHPYPWLVLALMVVLSFLMLSKIRVEKGAYFTPERLVRTWRGWGLLLGVVFTAVLPWAGPFVVFSTMLILVIARELLARVRKSGGRATPGISEVNSVAADE
jgi:CDP-diacylglycerol---serine O-phosphatidyltransferase